MSVNFGIELPEESIQLTDKEYVNLVNRIRGNFLSYVSVLDSALTGIISDFFLRDKDDFALWAKTVFDEDRTASFGAKIMWLSRILKNHAIYQAEITNEARKKIQCGLDEVRIIRNDFAHNFAQNKKIDPDDVVRRRIRLYDFEGGKVVPKYFGMKEIVGILNDPWILENLAQIRQVTEKIRNGRYDADFL